MYKTKVREFGVIHDDRLKKCERKTWRDELLVYLALAQLALSVYLSGGGLGAARTAFSELTRWGSLELQLLSSQDSSLLVYCTSIASAERTFSSLEPRIQSWNRTTASLIKMAAKETPKMEYTRLGNSGLKISKVIFGAMSLGSSDW